MHAPRDPEPLLAEASWLRALALRLCADVHAAEDAAQDALVSALQRPPRDASRMRSFLASTLRNALAMARRGARRRTVREHDVAAAAAIAPGTDDLVARAELHRELVAAVLALPATARELVLRHYYEGEPVAALARRLRTTPDAVRAQLRRARERLRERLEAGDRGAARSFALLLAVTRPSTPAAAQALVPAAALALLAVAASAVAAVWFAQRAPAPATVGLSPATAAGAAVAAERPAPSAATEPAASARVDVAPARTLHGQLAGLHPQVPWTTTLALHAATAGEPAREHRAAVPVDRDGAFRVPLPSWTATHDASVRVTADDPGYLPAELVLAAATLAADDVAELVVDAATTVVGRVVDARGVAVPDARVGAFLPRAVPKGQPRGDTLLRAATTSDADGRYRLRVSAAGAAVVLAAAMQPAGAAARARDELQPAGADVELRWNDVTTAPPLVLGDAAWITGCVALADGTPLPDVELAWFPALDDGLPLFDACVGNLVRWPDGGVARVTFARTDAAGRFRLAAPPARAGRCQVRDAQGRSEPLVDLLPATAPAELAVPIARVAVVRVVAGGRPLPGAAVGVAGSLEHLVPPERRRRTDRDGEVRLPRSRIAPAELLVQRLGDRPLHVALRDDASAAAPQLVDLGPNAPIAVELHVDAPVPVRRLAASWRPEGGGLPSAVVPLARDDVAAPFLLELPPQRGELSIGPLAPDDGPERLLLWTPIALDASASAPLRLSPALGGRLRVHVRDANGFHLAGSVELARDGRPHAIGLDGQRPTETDGLAPGTWQLTVRPFGRKAQRREVVVHAGVVTDVHVRFP
jgi:RNA polymerase sigma factor (sigma-70 family)